MVCSQVILWYPSAKKNWGKKDWNWMTAPRYAFWSSHPAEKIHAFCGPRWKICFIKAWITPWTIPRLPRTPTPWTLGQCLICLWKNCTPKYWSETGNTGPTFGTIVFQVLSPQEYDGGQFLHPAASRRTNYSTQITRQQTTLVGGIPTPAEKYESHIGSSQLLGNHHS